MSSPTEKPMDPPSPPVVPPKKRRKPSSAGHTVSPHLTSSEDDDNRPHSPSKRHQTPKQQSVTVPQSTPPFAPAVMALPPSLLSPYPHPQLGAAVSYYHPLYPTGPLYLPVVSSPPLTPQSRSRSTSLAGSAPRILPKTAPADTSNSPIPGQPFFASQPLHPNNPEYVYPHPFNIPIAPAPSGPSSSSPADTRELTTADQREQARKVSHSAIERRRRERINDKIVQLRQLIPSCANQGHLHKMTVLQSAIDYIAYLKDVISRLDREDIQDELKAKDTEQTTGGQLSFTSDIGVTTTTTTTTLEISLDEQEHGDTTAPKGMKPIDVIRAGTPSSAITPVPSLSSAHSQDWPSSTPTILPPPLLAKASEPSSLPATTISPETSSIWSEDSCASPSLPTPSLTPQSGPNQKHMSVENLLC